MAPNATPAQHKFNTNMLPHKQGIHVSKVYDNFQVHHYITRPRATHKQYFDDEKSKQVVQHA